jgi:ornithine cyclodeaminase
LPKIQGWFVLFDSATLTPQAFMDGAALTAIRTPALSALGVKYLAPPSASRLLVFGTGPQARNHIRAVAAVRRLSEVTVVGRTTAQAHQFAESLPEFRVTVGDAPAVSEADIILCCTSATEPLFDGRLVRDEAVVVAMGSHEPDMRETDDVLVQRSSVYVEDIATAVREAGDVVIPMAHGILRAQDLHPLSQLIRDGAAPRTGPAFFKTVGMGWQDLIAAAIVYSKSA